MIHDVLLTNPLCLPFHALHPTHTTPFEGIQPALAEPPPPCIPPPSLPLQVSSCPPLASTRWARCSCPRRRVCGCRRAS